MAEAEGREAATAGEMAERGARGSCAGGDGNGGSWSGGAGRGSGAPAHRRPEGMSPISLRHRWAWRIENLRGGGGFQKLGRRNMK